MLIGSPDLISNNSLQQVPGNQTLFLNSANWVAAAGQPDQRARARHHAAHAGADGPADEPGRVLQLPVPAAGGAGGGRGGLVDATLDALRHLSYESPNHARLPRRLPLVLAVLVFGLDKFNIGPTAAANANATATTTAGQQPQIFQFDDSKVNAFELHQADKSVRIEKQGDSWIVAGTGDPANRSSFTSLIMRMSTLKATRQVDNPGTDLSQYGLDTPKESAIAHARRRHEVRARPGRQNARADGHVRQEVGRRRTSTSSPTSSAPISSAWSPIRRSRRRRRRLPATADARRSRPTPDGDARRRGRVDGRDRVSTAPPRDARRKRVSVAPVVRYSGPEVVSDDHPVQMPFTML